MTSPEPVIPGADLPENQFERTLLAWRRTMIGVLVVLGIGGIHITMENRPVAGAAAGVAALFAIIPIVSRINALRRHQVEIALWQPLSLVVGLAVLGILLTFVP